jgi:hypothetical protein
MSTQVQLRRDVAANVAAFAGAPGECVVDTTNNRLVLQDGATAGGFPAAKLSEVFGRRVVSDANATATAADVIIAFASITATRTVTLPAAAAYPAGHELTIQDETGALSPALQILVAASGADAIAGLGAIALSQPFGGVRLRSNGVDAWFPAAGIPGLLAQAPHGGGLSAFCVDQLVTLSGATTQSSLLIPAGAILLAVSNRVVTAITGASAYSCGVSGNAAQFGSALGVSVGATNPGLIGPNPFYAATPVLYTAAGGAFTGGQLRMTLHYIAVNAAAG